MDGVIENKDQYLRERGDPNDRLTQAHKQIQEEKNKGADDALRKIFEETDGFKQKTEKWSSDKDSYRAQNLPMTFILQKHREFEAGIENDFIRFKIERTKKS